MKSKASVIAFLLLALVVVTTGKVWGLFSASATNSGNEFAASSDFRPPIVARSVAQKWSGGSSGYIRPGATYRILADVSDTGSPPSGVASVSANTSSITGSVSNATLSPASLVADGLSYNRSSSQLTADSALPNGSYSFFLQSADLAGNSASSGPYGVVVDGTAPVPLDVQTSNGGAIAGRADRGDTIVFSFSEPLDPASVLSGWDGLQAASVVVRLTDATGSDTLSVFDQANTNLLPLGVVSLGRADYVNNTRSFSASTMSLSGNTIAIVLGNQSAAASTASASGTMTWSPQSSLTDRAGNPLSSQLVTESGGADREF